METTLALGLFGSLGTPELLIIAFVLLLLFGATKLPALGGAMGKTIKNFKKEMKDGMADDAPPSGPRACAKCGAEAKDPDAAFCPKCGEKM